MMPTIQKPQIPTSVFCCYKNHTPKIQVGTITDNRGQKLEKVIFPGETFLFETEAGTKLAIYIELAGKTTLLDSIPCSNLQIETRSS